ncbi:alpha/beta hydrolase [Gemmatimonas sp.]|uniref:alpha/beta fold hydrolase n=1 Tax=Gemmatimonas sp. TaxID=1962908 RepID=UPI00286E821F|nr:alpha/beta hydrolase [Gemmatimonas sp.]
MMTPFPRSWRVTALIASVGFALAPAAAPAQLVDTSFVSKGVRIHYVEQGRGVPVVLIHGIEGTLAGWRRVPIFSDLARDYRVIAIDQRGHGRSDKPHEAAAYGREMALDVVRLLDHLGLAKAHVVGYSLGAMVTSQLLTLHPERFRSAVLIAGAGRLVWNASLAEVANVEARERDAQCISPTLMARLRPPTEPAPTAERLRALSAACIADTTQDRFALAALTRSRADQVVAPAAGAAVTVPTLAIVGSLDPLKADLDALKVLRPSIEYVVVDSATHSGVRGILTRSETLTALRAFLGRPLP